MLNHHRQVALLSLASLVTFPALEAQQQVTPQSQWNMAEMTDSQDSLELRRDLAEDVRIIETMEEME